MKALIAFALAALTVTAVQAQSIDNGFVKTSEGGYTMTATIDGKPWKAEKMYPIALNSSIHACYAESTIDLPDPGNAKAGDKVDFGHGHGPIFAPPGPFDLYTVHTGHMEITKASGDWLEGTFSFTAVLQDNPSKKMEITNGFFRVAKKGH